MAGHCWDHNPDTPAVIFVKSVLLTWGLGVCRVSLHMCDTDLTKWKGTSLVAPWFHGCQDNIEGLVQDCSNSSALALQSCTEPPACPIKAALIWLKSSAESPGYPWWPWPMVGLLWRIWRKLTVSWWHHTRFCRLTRQISTWEAPVGLVEWISGSNGLWGTGGKQCQPAWWACGTEWTASVARKWEAEHRRSSTKYRVVWLKLYWSLFLMVQ